jgi:Ca2+-dependent lipid-binding protein
MKTWIPKMFLTFAKTRTYQLRAYMYQAKNLIAADDNGLSDPFAQVAFLNHSGDTVRQEATLSPAWDQTLILDGIEIPGDPDVLKLQPPDITIEVFDWDAIGNPDFLGRALAMPLVKLNDSDQKRTPKLFWHVIRRVPRSGGQC